MNKKLEIFATILLSLSTGCSKLIPTAAHVSKVKLSSPVDVPIPVPTLIPSPTSSPIPRPSVVSSPRPSPSTSVRPSPTPSPVPGAFSVEAGYNVFGVKDGPVTFQAKVTGEDRNLSYTWNFGDGNTGTGRTVTHNYSSVGVFTVTVRASVPSGRYAEDTTTATISNLVLSNAPRGDRFPMFPVDTAPEAFARIKSAADLNLTRGDSTNVSHLVFLYKVTRDRKYADAAVQWLSNYLDAADARIAAGEQPSIGGNSYLDVGPKITALSMIYDWCHDLVSAELRGRAEAFARQALYNVWHPTNMIWGGKVFTRGPNFPSPGNNYAFSYFKAATSWAIVSQDREWLAIMTQKFGDMMHYHAALPEGGSKEGTGYGESVRNLFTLYRWWTDTGYGNPASFSTHSRKTIDYWIHATAPTMDQIIPIGDLARDSSLRVYDYNRHIILEGNHLHPQSEEAKHGRWWLSQIPLQRMTHVNTSGIYDLLVTNGIAQAPSENFHFAHGVGHYFWRTGWEKTAAFIGLTAGSRTMDHDHRDKGSFALFKDYWRTVTANSWNAGGIQKEPHHYNTVRFERADGTWFIPGNPKPQLIQVTGDNTRFRAVLDLSNQYPDSGITWKRILDFDGRVLNVDDESVTPEGITPIWQLQVPDEPSLANSSFETPGLLVSLNPGVTLSKEDWTKSSLDRPGTYRKGWRVEARGIKHYKVQIHIK